ncbi:hypothetical protein KSC_014760 [Ktedonobacter sp. SOSP1-52]|uniref:hypothetical protein n=1 Tax=Ktedonobacter sp. SOSP1-52 TaxID=2778366 RepID=UPI001916B3F8|nr:hypothetical protein [Ktedonobacter sp. SOSP1-52]GHO62584.1 hypothetical protein KSC_014760 [Ktedonobacter sp. SOSP1-52]
MTIPFSEQQSEHWLLERTYHAQLRDGRELSVPDFTRAMKQLTDVDAPLSSQSWKSKPPEWLPAKKSTNVSIPISTWMEISPEEACTNYQEGSPILLYGEHRWEHLKEASETWRPNRNVCTIIYGNAKEVPEVVSGVEYAVCYLDPKRGHAANASWRAWFSSDVATLLNGSTHRNILFLSPCMQFPSTTHYTVIAADGQVHEYSDRAKAIQGYALLASQEAHDQSHLHSIFPQFCYYHEIICPDGVYRIEFFGPRMNEQGYKVHKG